MSVVPSEEPVTPETTCVVLGSGTPGFSPTQ